MENEQSSIKKIEVCKTFFMEFVNLLGVGKIRLGELYFEWLR